MEEIDQIKETLSQHGYEYIKFIGKGGFSNVLLCKSKKYNQFFAIKRAKKHHLTEDEYNLLIKLNHSNIIKLYDAFNDEYAQYLVMDYCNNGTILEKGKICNTKFVYYAKQILKAISFCHSNNIAHRDLKPDNIFLDQYDHIILADFGMAKQFDYDSKSSDKCGSLMFLAPETFLYQEICPFKADVWALGITFFYMITGKYPFRSSSREEIQQLISKGEIDFRHYEIHPKIKALIKKMTIKDQHNRPSVDKLLELPIFASDIKKIIFNASQNVMKPNTCNVHASQIACHKSLTFEPMKSEEESSKPEQSQQIDVHSYKTINTFPRIRRMNSHFPINSF